MPTNFWKKGQSGNPNGRPPKPEIQLLRDAIQEVQKEENKDLLKHYVRQAFHDNGLLATLMKKLLPDLKQVDAGIFMTGGMDLRHLTDEELDERIKRLDQLDAQSSGNRRVEAAAKTKQLRAKNTKGNKKSGK